MEPGTWTLITGVSAGGLGDALTTELLSRGVNVIATALELAQLDYLRPPADGTKLEKLYLDVTSSASISTAAQEVSRITGGQLHTLINNAGYGYMMPLLDADIAKIKRNFDVNFFGLLEVTQAMFPMLRAAGHAMVVNQGSIAGLAASGQPFIGTYTSSKAAVLSISNTMRLELAPFGIKVVILVTGDVETEFWNNARTHVNAGLPADSPYISLKDHVEAFMLGEARPVRPTPRDQWAKAVVDDLSGTNAPRAVRRGALATTMWIASWLIPAFVLDWAFTRTFRLNNFKSDAKAEGNKKVQ